MIDAPRPDSDKNKSTELSPSGCHDGDCPKSSMVSTVLYIDGFFCFEIDYPFCNLRHKGRKVVEIIC